MKKLILSILSILTLSGAAQAQPQSFINYYLSPQSQIDAQARTNYYAQAAANAWLQHCQQLRAQGYTGQIYCPWNAQTLNQSNRQLQSAYDSYNQGWYQNQAVQSQAANNWSSMMRDQQAAYSPNGQLYYVQPSQGNYHWVNPYTGQVYSTNTGYAPDYRNYYQPLR